MSGKYYAIVKGRNPGIYRSWGEAEPLIRGFPGALYKSFTTLAEAQAFIDASTAGPAVPLYETGQPGKTIIYTDGSFVGNSCGFGVVILMSNGEKITAHGKVPMAPTNNVAELYAIYAALSLIATGDVILYSDSQYAINSLTTYIHGYLSKGWVGVANAALIQGAYNKMQGRNVILQYVAAHVGHRFNEECDRLANIGRLSDQAMIINRTGGAAEAAAAPASPPRPRYLPLPPSGTPLPPALITPKNSPPSPAEPPVQQQPTLRIVQRDLRITSAVKLDTSAECRDLCSRYNIPADTFIRKLNDPLVSATRRANVAAGKRGKVFLGKAWRAQKSEEIPVVPGAVPIYVSNGKGNIGTAVSPFNLPVPRRFVRGTVDGNPTGAPLWNGVNIPMELWWQSSKVAKSEVHPITNVIADSYWRRRAAIYRAGVAKRRYIDVADIYGAVFGNKGDPVYQYIDSRVFYCQAYEEAIMDPNNRDAYNAFSFLDKLLEAGVNILLLGPDADPLPSGDDLGSPFDVAYHSTVSPFGHERVIAALLSRDTPWKAYLRYL
jgi:ribonuclease HI